MKLSVNHEQSHLEEHQLQRRGRPRRQQLQPYLKTGSVVEVNSDEKGLKGVWYQATILNSSSLKKKSPYYGKVYVEYKSLISDKDSSKPLRKYVNAEFVRPVPPVDNHPLPFIIGVIVDAYYSDGWLTGGVITEIVDGPRFVVTFHNSPHARDFAPSDLRLHREWVDGSWSTLANQRAAELMCSVGKRVEVSFNTGGSEDIWFPATIIEDKGNGLFMAEYHKCNREGCPRNVRENVDSLHIRPCPPPLKKETFCLFDKVDAFYDFGWWSGVITKELAESRYNVFFKHTKKDREFLFSELRPHMEWKDGKWFSSSQEVSIPSDYEMYDGGDKNGSTVGVTVPLSSPMPTETTYDENTPFSSSSTMNNNDEQVAPSNDEPQVINSSPREMTLDSPYSGKETLKGEAHLVAPSTETNAYNTSDETLSNVEENAQPLGAYMLNGSHSLQKKVKRKRGMFAEKEETAVERSGKTLEKKVQVKTFQNTIGGKEGNEADSVTEDVPRDCPIVETSFPVVIGLACDYTKISAIKQFSQSKGKEAVKSIRDESVKATNQLEDLNETTQRRGRGRPRKHVESPSIITPMLDIEVTTKLEASTIGQVVVVGTNGSDDQIEKETSPLIKDGENAVEASSVKHQYVRQPTKRGRKRMMELHLISNVHDVASPKSGEGKITETEETERAVPESLSNNFDNQPLSKWLGDLNFPAVVDNSSSSDKNMEIIIKEATTTVNEEIIPDVEEEVEKFPFEKKSPIWSVLKSMEVFQKLPQKPHFHPLEKLKENVREGLAIGLMVTFTVVVERTSKMKYDDPKASINDVLETVMELETHGFDVRVVHERIANLERIKEKQEKLEEEVRKLKSEMEENENEKKRIDEEMKDIKKEIKEVQEKLSKAMSLKEIKEGETNSLHLKMISVKEDIKNIQCEFEGGVGLGEFIA